MLEAASQPSQQSMAATNGAQRHVCSAGLGYLGAAPQLRAVAQQPSCSFSDSRRLGSSLPPSTAKYGRWEAACKRPGGRKEQEGLLCQGCQRWTYRHAQQHGQNSHRAQPVMPIACCKHVCKHVCSRARMHLGLTTCQCPELTQSKENISYHFQRKFKTAI